MIIGFDIDDTITDTSNKLVGYAIKYNKIKKIKYNINPNEWEFEKAYGWDKNNIIEFKKQYLLKIFKEIMPREHSKEIINKLKNEGNKIILITSRGIEDDEEEKNSTIIKKITVDWLKEQNIKYDKLIIGCKDKAKICIENNIEVFFDDAIHNCKQINQVAKIPVYMYNCRYNIDANIENIKKVYSWDEVYQIVKKMSSINV